MEGTAISIRSSRLYFIPISLRMPLKFGLETGTHTTCARACVRVEDARGRSAIGWGETPLSVRWVWPGALPYEERNQALLDFCRLIARAFAGFPCKGHPVEIGHAFLETELPALLDRFNAGRTEEARMPWLAALVCCSIFDIALHDAFGMLHAAPTYTMYTSELMNADLSAYLTPEGGATGGLSRPPVSFAGRYPADFFVKPAPTKLKAWHLVGGMDPLSAEDLTGQEPKDGYPVLLPDWIRADGLTCLKVKLRGNDAAWDYERLVRVGKIAISHGADWLSADFNCTVSEPAYVTEILDRLVIEEPRIYGSILYVEQPFPYDLEANPIDVRAVSARKPLFMDESAHDWKIVRLGRTLGWTGVALKTCKTQTGALLSLCWAKAHGMTLMVQDLTNPMLAQVTHALLAAHAGTIMGVETNSMQYYPEVSRPEAAVHPGLYARRNGEIDLSTVRGPGFGYRVSEIRRTLPEPAAEHGW